MGTRYSKAKIINLECQECFIVDGHLKLKINETEIEMKSDDYIDELCKNLVDAGATNVAHIANGNTIGKLMQIIFEYNGYKHHYHVFHRK